MSNTGPNHSPLEQLEEELVAYLDGELEPQAAQRLEETLAGNEQARQRLNQLANSWELLDQLPRATVDDLFTRTTVEMVALAAEDEVVRSRTDAPHKRKLRILGGAVAVLCAAAVGFAIMALAMPDRNDPLLQDLPVIQNLELYQSVTSIDFLKQLQAAKLFSKDNGDAAAEITAPETSTPGSSPAAAAVVPTSITERRAWVEALSASDKNELRSNLERFVSLSAKEQESLRELDKAFQGETVADAAQLRHVMERYYEWWKTLTPLDRNELRSETDPAKRIGQVEQFRADQRRQIFSRLSSGWQIFLKDADSQAIIRWMANFARNHRNELPTPPEEMRADPQRAGPRLGRPSLPLAYEYWWSITAPEFPKVTDAELRALRDQVSPEKQQQFDRTPGLSDRVRLVRTWAQIAWREAAEVIDKNVIRWGNFGPTRQSLNRFMNSELSNTERRELQGLPEVEKNRKLRELFFQRHPDLQRPSGALPRAGGDLPPVRPNESPVREGSAAERSESRAKAEKN